MITQVRTMEKEGYSSVQIGFGEQKEQRLTKPVKGHLKDLATVRFIREFRVDNVTEYERGGEVTVAQFEVNDVVSVTGTSKGKGFQGSCYICGVFGHRSNNCWSAGKGEKGGPYI